MNRTARPVKNVRKTLAQHLVEQGLRAPIVKRISHVAQSVVSTYYQEHHGDNSPSGQMPTNLYWFTDEPRASKHAALLVLIYLGVYDQVKASAKETSTRESITAIAFGRTLAIYGRHCCAGNTPPISPERAYLLIQHFADRTVWARNANSANGIKLAYCSRCAVPLIVRSQFRAVACDCCQKERANGKLH